MYIGEGVLWSDNVLEGDNMVVEFYELEELTGIKILTGSEDHPRDTLQHGVVEYKRSVEGEYDFFRNKTNSFDTCQSCCKSNNWLMISHFECLK